MARSSPATIADAHAAAAGYEGLQTATIEPLGAGLINDTFAVQAPAGAFVLQRVHPVFAPEIHHNIAAVTEHLARRGVATPRLVVAEDGRNWVVVSGQVWRLMTRVPGTTFDRAQGPSHVQAAAAALARFHGELADLEHEFVGMRAGVHDTRAHLSHLRQCREDHRGHPMYDEIARLGDAIEGSASTLSSLTAFPQSIVHGDPKFNNIVFAGSQGASRDRVTGIIDLDTVGPGSLALELGDAWRSWCNPKGEDERVAVFELDVYRASLRGYAGATTLRFDAAQRQDLGAGVEWITLELAARFAADTLAEAYFGWDRRRYHRAAEHNLVRAQGQWSLHKLVVAQRPARAEIIEVAFGPGSSASGS